MKNINLFKPIILRKSLEDMSESQKDTALNLLHNRLFIAVSASGLEFMENKKDIRLPEIFFYGSEAVCIYRQSLNLPNISIRFIHVNNILSEAEDFSTCFDILFFLNQVHMQNKRAGYLHGIGAPAVILWNEYLQLQQRAEFLENNNWCGHPVTNSFDIPYENDAQEPEHCEETRKSLNDIGLSLLQRSSKDKRKRKRCRLCLTQKQSLK